MKKIRVPVLVSLAAALAAASGPFLDRQETLRQAASGMAARVGLVEAGPIEKLAALAWEHGGWMAADALRALVVAGPIFLILLLAALALPRLPEKVRTAGRWIWSGAAALLFAVGIWHGVTTLRSGLRDPRLLAPADLLTRAESTDGRIFFNTNALFHAALFSPGKIEPGSSFDQSARLAASPAEWRAEDRRSPFAAVVLTGTIAQSAPLLDMLRTMPGWTLAIADNQGLLFTREKFPTQESKPETAKTLFENPNDQAVYLAQCAMVQLAAGNPEAARTLLLEASRIAAGNSHVLLCTAMFAAQEGRWRETLEAARSTLKRDPRSIQAAHLQALALLETGAVSKAAEKIHTLAASRPNDSAILGLQARIARVNNDPTTEVAALEKLLALAKRHNQPTGTLHALLGQAWARRGFPAQALENFQAALATNPPPDQRKALEESIEVIRTRTR